MSGNEGISGSAPDREGQDEHLIRRLQQDRTEALGDVLQAYSEGLRRRLRSVFDSSLDGDLDDLLSEALVRLWEHRQRLDPATPLEAWLYVVARNLGWDILREREKRSSVAFEGADFPARQEDPSEPSTVFAPMAALLEVLGELDETDRRILAAFAHDGDSGRWAADLAREMPHSAGALRVRKHRLLERLRAALARGS